MAFITSGQKTEWALFLQLRSQTKWYIANFSINSWTQYVIASSLHCNVLQCYIFYKHHLHTQTENISATNKLEDHIGRFGIQIQRNTSMYSKALQDVSIL